MTSETTPTATTQTADITSPIVTGDTPQPVVTSPIVDTNPPAPEPAPAEPAPAPAPSMDPDWYVKRINEVTAKRFAAERLAEQERDARLAAERTTAELLAKQPASASPNPAPENTFTKEQMEKLAEEKAQDIARAAKFNDECNKIADSGKAEFKDWDEALKNLSLAGAIGQGASPEFLETAIELRAPHKILHHLGKNLEEAERISKLPPKRMAMEMARLEAQLNVPAPAPAPAPVSQAPAPVIPVGGVAKAGAPDINDPNISSEDFYRLRAQQIEDRRKRYQRV